MCVCSVMSESLCPMDCSPSVSSVHGIFPARILEWVVISFSRGSSPPRDGTWVSCRQILLPSDPPGTVQQLGLFYALQPLGGSAAAFLWKGQPREDASKPDPAKLMSFPKVYWWRRAWQPTPVLLPRKSHGQRSLVGCSPWGL